MVVKPWIDETFTMAPRPAARIPGTVCLVVSHAAFRSTAKKASHSSDVISTRSKLAFTPALLTSTGRRTELGRAAADELGDLVLHPDVAAVRAHVVADGGGGLRADVLVDVAERHPGALAGEPFDGGPADPARTTGDEDDVAVEAGHLRAPAAARARRRRRRG